MIDVPPAPASVLNWRPPRRSQVSIAVVSSMANFDASAPPSDGRTSTLNISTPIPVGESTRHWPTCCY